MVRIAAASTDQKLVSTRYHIHLEAVELENAGYTGYPSTRQKNGYPGTQVPGKNTGTRVLEYPAKKTGTRVPGR